jgi:hypothetical protein
MQFWQCPLLLMVSLIAAINTQQTPSQRLEPNQVAGFVQLHKQLEQQQEQHQQQPEQPAQADNKVRTLCISLWDVILRCHPSSLSSRYFSVESITKLQSHLEK